MNDSPIFLYKMRVERTYTGGKLLDQWQGVTPGIDGWKPEEWVASTIRSRFAADPNAGLSIIKNKELDGVLLKDFISTDPESLLGKEHYKNYGENLGFLTKIIDSDKRLNIQTHPDREHAKKFFNSDFGKTEAWYVMDTRLIEGRQPFVLLGFKPGMTKEKWMNLIESQDRNAMVDSMHKIPVQKGDVFLIESGVPHAIGSGCMIAEIQEPTDFTFRVEKISTADKEFPEETYHQGIGYDNMYNCFDYNTYELDELLKRMKLQTVFREENENYSLLPLIGKENTSYFSMERVKVKKNWNMLNDLVFAVVIVLDGSGIIESGGGDFFCKKGDEIFFPCSSEIVRFVNQNEKSSLKLLVSYPPMHPNQK